MNNFAIRNWVLGLAVILTTAQANTLDVGGGGGKPLTPYDAEVEESIHNVTNMYNRANGLRMIQNVKITGSHATKTAYKIGFAFLYDSNLLQPVSTYSLRGSDSSDKPVEIDLARVESITIVANGEDRTRLSVSIFPDIDPQELLTRRPTYTELLKHFRREVLLQIPGRQSDGRRLFLIGTTWSGTDKFSVAIPVSTLAEHEVIKIRDDFGPWLRGPWWAISSVTEDKAYPYRNYTKR